MNTNRIYGMIVVSVIILMGVIVGCSDNVDPQYDPISSADRTLTINGSPRDTTINLTAGAATRVIRMKSNTRWTVRVIDGGGWCTTDVLSGKGDESFTINVLENLGGDVRTCTIEVSAVDAEGQEDSNKSLQKSITVIQEKSSVRISPSSIEAFPAAETSQSFDIFANAAWTLDVSYENDNTARFITLTPGENMAVASEGKYKGNGNAKFSITLANNGSDASRLGYLNLVSEVGKYTVEIRQNKSEYTFDVSPSERQQILPQGGTKEFTVLSHSEWTVSCSDPSVTFYPAFGQGNGEVEYTTATFQPNLTDTIKTMRLRFEPKKDNYVPQEVVVIQQAFPMTFNVNNGTLPALVMEEGGEYTINVTSMFDWKIADTPDWMAVSPKEGKRSENSVTLNVKVNLNTSERQRDGVIKVIPLITEFYDGVSIDPVKVGVMQHDVPVTQFGGQKPAVSVPWLSDGVSHMEAELSFNYYSPYIDIVSAGLEWKSEDATEWEKEEVKVTDAKSGTVTFQLTGLKPMEGYVARGYVIASDGKSYPGTAMLTFKTAGQFPGSGDNPTPTK